MSKITPEEIDGIVEALKQEELPLGEHPQISKVRFSAFSEEEPSPPQSPPTDKEKANWKDLKVALEVQFGSKKLTFQELATLKTGDLVIFDELAEEPVDIIVGGKRVGRGEIVTMDGHFGVKIADLL